MDETLSVLDRRWVAACRAVFGKDAGPLEGYSAWLSQLVESVRGEKSCESGKGVSVAIPDYAPGSRFLSLDEIPPGKRFPPLSLNGITDIDSLARALSGRFCYAGNVVLGNSAHVEKSSSITDSFYLRDCALLGDSKYLYKCALGRLNEDCFGTYAAGESQLCIRCSQTYRFRRCFETWMSQNCADCYYCYNLQNCSDCIFCFNVKNKRHAIGNRELAPSKYAEIKRRLLSEMLGGLRRDKRLPSLLEIAEKCRLETPPGLRLAPIANPGGKSKDAVEREFCKTTKLIFGSELPGIDSYGGWLMRHVKRPREEKSAASGKNFLSIPYAIAVVDLPQDRLLSMEEAAAWGESAQLGEQEAEAITLANAHEKLGRLAYFAADFWEGQNQNLEGCSMTIDSSNCYRTTATVYSKYCAYSFWPRSSEHAFGCGQLFDSSFCINCYYSVKLQRCFECDSCRSCSDAYFCHNCENCRDCMFCFNAKNLRHAIGNVEIGKEKYERIRDIALADVARRLLRGFSLSIDIYNLGAAKVEP